MPSMNVRTLPVLAAALSETTKVQAPFGSWPSKAESGLAGLNEAAYGACADVTPRIPPPGKGDPHPRRCVVGNRDGRPRPSPADARARLARRNLEGEDRGADPARVSHGQREADERAAGHGRGDVKGERRRVRPRARRGGEVRVGGSGRGDGDAGRGGRQFTRDGRGRAVADVLELDADVVAVFARLDVYVRGGGAVGRRHRAELEQGVGRRAGGGRDDEREVADAPRVGQAPVLDVQSPGAVRVLPVEGRERVGGLERGGVGRLRRSDALY